MRILKEREKQIKRLRDKGYSLAELGIAFNISRERVRQILKKIDKRKAFCFGQKDRNNW